MGVMAPDPMTGEQLAAMRRRVDAYTGPDHYRFTIDGIEYDAHWAHDTRRLLDENARLNAELAEAEQKRLTFTEALGYGNDRTEPAAALADMVEPILEALSAARDHDDCPTYCELCGDRLAELECGSCYGSGCGPRTAEGAYDECSVCAGAGRVHEGCVGRSYEDLAVESVALTAELAARDATITALSERCTAKGLELDRCIREAAADKAKLAEIGEGSEEWAIRVFHRPGGSGYYFHDSTGEDPEQDLADVLELLADGRDMAGNPVPHGPVSIVKRTVWSTEWETVAPTAETLSAFDGAPPIRANKDGSQSYGPYAAPEMPRPPTEEARSRPEIARGSMDE